MEEKVTFTDLLDEYLATKAAWYSYCDGLADYGPGGQHLYDQMDRAKRALNEMCKECARLATIAERERAAKVCDEVDTPTYRHGGREYDDTVALRELIAAAIRKG